MFIFLQMVRILPLRIVCLVAVLFLTLSSQEVFASSRQKQQTHVHTLAISPSSCKQVPPNFDPLKATASQIDYYDLPPRPTGGADSPSITNWAQSIKQIKHLKCNNEMLHPHWRVTGGGNFRSPGSFASSKHSFIYSGYETNGNDAQSLSGQTQIKGNWNTQCLGSNNAQGAEVATWVGVGGIYGPLIQVGTILMSDGYHLFYEDPDIQFVQLDPATFGCRTSITANVWKNGSNQWCIQSLRHDGSGFGDQYCYPSADQANMETAEWVDERPLCGGNSALLADFNYTTFSNGYAYSPSRGWHTIAGWDPSALTMVPYPNSPYPVKVFAQPDNIQSGGTNFTDRWKNTGDGTACF